MQLRALGVGLILLALAGLGIWKASDVLAGYLEGQRLERSLAFLEEGAHDWAELRADGLQMRVSGEAPDEATRFRALAGLQRMLGARNVTDLTTLRSPAPGDVPGFSLELLRSGPQISLIGLVPAKMPDESPTGEAIRAALSEVGLDANIAEALETVAAPAPNEWISALSFGLDVLAEFESAKISVAPGMLNVAAVVNSTQEAQNVRERLPASAPEDVELSLWLSAPRPIISPYRIGYEMNAEGGRFLACSAEDAQMVSDILTAAQAIGYSGEPGCAIGLGAPTLDWPAAFALGLRALGDLGGGRFEITDTQAVLTGPQGVDPETLQDAGAALERIFPAAYGVRVQAPDAPAPAAGDAPAPRRFEAALDVSGALLLRGPVQDAASLRAIESYAAAAFGADNITNQMLIVEGLPTGWPSRILAGLGALRELRSGNMAVTPETVQVNGWGVSADTQDRVRAALEERVGAAQVTVQVDEQAAAAVAAAAARATMSRPEICASEVAAILESASIAFRPGSSQIDPESSGVIAAIADVLRECPGAAFRISGHTDDQGSEGGNLRLSAQRAEAVSTALRDLDLPLIDFESVGYGSEFPVADNETAEGRRANRRIEIVLLTGADEGPDDPPGATVAATGTLSAGDCTDQLAAVLAEEPLQFASGASEIAPASLQTIADLGDILRACPAIALEIGGHTDSQGSAASNQSLSEARAEAVRDALQEQDLPVTLSAVGYGEENPVADNATAEGRAQNRRIEFTQTGGAPGEENQDDGSQ